MKLTIILLSASIMASAGGKTQGLSLSMKNAPIEKVFKEIKKQTGYTFMYTETMLMEAKKVTIDVKNSSLEQTLNLCFANQPFSWTIIDKTIVLKPKEEKSPNEKSTESGNVTLSPVEVDITGKVTDENGNPLAGASVKVKNSNKGTTTNNDGVFVLKGVADDAVLEISYVGFEGISIPVGSRTSIVTSLKQKPENLGEVIIRKGYYDEKQRYTLGNSVQIDAKQIEKAPVQNPLLAIQGLAPGIEITQLTGMNGGGINVKIQGPTSINYENLKQPLIIVDGVPFPVQNRGGEILSGLSIEGIVQGGSPLNYINPNDIESITILKDADATAIYGSRAANGAIVITTKKGKVGKTKLTLNLQQGWGKVGHFVDMMNTRQYLDMRYEAYRNDGIALSTQTLGSNNYDLKLWDTTRYTNWQKTLIGGTAQYSNFQVGLSGGTTNLQYLIGATYNRQTVVFPGDFDDKVGNLHFNINGSSANQRLKVQLTGSYAYDQNHLPGFDLTNQSILLEPNAPALYNTDGTINWAPNPAGRSSWSNPLASILNSDFINATKNLVGNMSISYRILSGLDFRSSFGYTNTQSEIYTPYRLELYKPEDRILASREANFGNRNMSSWNIEPQLQYSGNIGKGKIDAFLGTTIQKSSYTYLAITGSGFASDLLMKTLRSATSTNIRQSLSGITRFNALFGRLGYNWDGKYLINLTARRDGSNKFGPEARFHNFTSVAAGWIFSEEKWIAKQLPFLSFGKLRASYGTTGSDGIPDFGYLSIYQINNPTILYQGSIGLYANNIPNPFLQWEETRKWQGGLDLGFIKDRVLLGVTYALNRSSNQLAGITIPSVTGFQAINKNQSFLVQNASWEFTMNTVNLKSKNLSWSTSLNLTIPRNKLASVPEQFKAGNQDLGKPLGYIPVVHYAGVNPANGRYVVLDKNGNPMTASPAFEDQNIFLSNLSQYYGGVLNSIQYKGFQLDFLFQFVRKRGSRDMYYGNGGRPGNFSGASTGNQPVSVLDRWQKPGDDATIGRFTTGTIVSTIYTLSDAWYSYEASYIKLKNVSLSWQLPTSLIKKARLQNARIYAHAQNLITFTKYRGLDPETMSSKTLPPLRMITTGVSVEF